MDVVVLCTAAALTGLWGVSHLFATRSVVAGFGDLTADNGRIVTMEWIGEGIALLSISAFVVAATVAHPADSTEIYAVAAGTLVIMAVVSLFTGFKIAFLPFKLCPFIFGLSAALIALGAWL